MLVTMNQIKQGMALYMKNEVLPNLSTDGFAGFGVSFVSTLAIGYIDRFLVNLAANPLIGMFGFMDDQGRVELDSLSEALSFAMPETGISVPIGKTQKITFRADDVQKLIEYIAK